MKTRTPPSMGVKMAQKGLGENTISTKKTLRGETPQLESLRFTWDFGKLKLVQTYRKVAKAKEHSPCSMGVFTGRPSLQRRLEISLRNLEPGRGEQTSHFKRKVT